MNTLNESEIALLTGLEKYAAEVGEGALIDKIFQLIDNWNIPERLYIPDETLKRRLKDFEKWCEEKDRKPLGERDSEEAGELMEEIAFLALRCLKGYEAVKSYQSFAGQIDLVVSGSTSSWILLMKVLHLDAKFRSIVVEAKNLQEKVDDKQFSRFCYHLQNTFVNTAQLGIFFTRLGATGFPKSMSASDRVRQRSLRDAQATQILFYARSSKFVVVLNKEDIINLREPGTLVRLLERKVRAIEEWTGIVSDDESSLPEVDIPGHLLKYI